MKKIILILGSISVIVGIFGVLSFINTKSHFSYPVSDYAQINIKAGTGNLNFTSSSTKSTVSGYLSHKILSKTGFIPSSNTLELNTGKANGEIELPSNINFADISVVFNAGNLDLNLKQSQVSNVSLISGASNVKLILPQDSSSKFDFTIGAGNLNLVIPLNGKLDGVKIISALNGMELGDAWVQVSDGIETKGFDKAQVTSIIDLSKSGTVNLHITTKE